MKKIFLCLTISWGIISCTASKAGTSFLPENHAHVLFQSQYGGSGEESIEIITEPQEFLNRWQEITGQPQEELPKFNSEEEMVVIKNFMSNRTGGTTFTIEKIEQKKGHIQVIYSAENPGDFATDAITSPVLMVMVKKQIQPTIEFTLQN